MAPVGWTSTDRRSTARRHPQSVETLHWTTPGRVWAMDHTDPPGVIDGQYPDVLAVRDLASGMQLAWLPVASQTAEWTARELEILFLCYGPPLVLKSDNGSAFISHLLRALLACWHVVPLFSPVQMPEYNGACEAGIGAMEQRTFSLAACMGRTWARSRFQWTSDALHAARRQANEFHRPWGHRGPTPREVWEARQPITADERARFAATLARCQQQVSDTLGSLARGNARPDEALAHGNPPALAPPAHGNTLPEAPAAQDNALDGGATHGNLPAVDFAPSERQANSQTVTSAQRALNLPLDIHGSSPEALIHRRAVRQALIELGLLSITRRSITLPIKCLKSAKIM
jgi:transposase InsO family protein